MWIVSYALRRKYTIGVLAILIFLLGNFGARRMPYDILPVNIPAINLIWTYSGLNARRWQQADLVQRVGHHEQRRQRPRASSRETVNGVGIVRIEFQPDVEIGLALSQVAPSRRPSCAACRPASPPPIVIRYSMLERADHPARAVVHTLSDAQLYDYARLQLRAQIQTIPGIRMTLPYGGQVRQIMVDLDPQRLQAYGLTPADMSRAVDAQNLTLPSGRVKRKHARDFVDHEPSPETAAAFHDLPLRAVDGRVIFLRDVANVRDGGRCRPTSRVWTAERRVRVAHQARRRLDRRRSSTRCWSALPDIRAAAPEGVASSRSSISRCSSARRSTRCCTKACWSACWSRSWCWCSSAACAAPSSC